MKNQLTIFSIIYRKSGPLIFDEKGYWIIKPKRNVLLVMALALALVFALSTCGNRSDSVDVSSISTSESDSAESEETPESEKTDVEDSTLDQTAGNILVAYFSHTGNTEKVAQETARYIGADLAEIRRAEEYGDLYEEAGAGHKFSILFGGMRLQP